MIRVRVSPEDFDTGAELARLEAGAGAVASFTGIVRGDGGLAAMTLEHYPAMTEKALAGITAEAERSWPIIYGTIIHCVGRPAPGARILLVDSPSSHRATALVYCAVLTDSIKPKAAFRKLQAHAGRGRHPAAAGHAAP